MRGQWNASKTISLYKIISDLFVFSDKVRINNDFSFANSIQNWAVYFIKTSSKNLLCLKTMELNEITGLMIPYIQRIEQTGFLRNWTLCLFKYPIFSKFVSIFLSPTFRFFKKIKHKLL